MAQRRHHYEAAFEVYLRHRRIPYVAVDEAKKSLLPGGLPGAGGVGSLKSFDFVLYGQGSNLLAEVKGRRVVSPRRLERWVTLDDVESLRAWESLFGPQFEACFIFMYLHEMQPADALFEELFDHEGRWYALRAVSVRRYQAAMRVRSERWRTVDLEPRVFERLSEPFSARTLQGCGDAPPALMPLDG